MIVVTSPNYGLEHGVSTLLPSLLLFGMGAWLLWKERGALFASSAQRRFVVLTLLLLVPISISVPGSYQATYSLGVALALLLYFVAGVALIRALQSEERRVWLMKWILLVVGFWTVDSVIQYVAGRDLFGVALSDDGRVLGPFDGNLRQATFMAMLLPVMLGYLMPRKNGLVLALAVFLVISAVAMLSSVRMVLVMLAIVLAGFYLRLPRSRWKWPLLLSLPVLAALAISLSPALKQRMSTFTAIETLDFATVDKVLSNRATIWETGAHMLLGRPLTGIGAGAFEKAYNNYATRPHDIYATGQARVTHAHQVYVGAAAETGLPGLLGLMAAVVLCMVWYRSASPARRDQAWPYALALTVYFFPLNTQPPLFRHWLFPMILLLLAAFLTALDEPGAHESAHRGN